MSKGGSGPVDEPEDVLWAQPGDTLTGSSMGRSTPGPGSSSSTTGEHDSTMPAEHGAGLRDVPFVDAARYAIEGEFARGGAGRLLAAQDNRLGRPVAIKESLDAREGGARLVREALVTARLQHPAIVPVHDAGRWPSGDPFYTMKLLRGHSLRDVIKATTSLDERLALLPTVIAVAEAIAYAHSERIIHRDLKPSNVLVGAFGETVVIDWGLAKDLAGPADADDSVRPAARSIPEGATETGAVVGTPAYMPPEQARGERVDERADVYALGALLFHVLAGVAPYQARDGRAVLAQVLAGSPTPLDARQPGVPRDLATIVSKAMARDPAARYPTAMELADDLKRYQTGKLVAAHEYSRATLVGRWLRRHRAVVAVAAAGLVVLAGGAAIGVRRVLGERDRAQHQRAAAEGLVEFMLFKLRERLAPVGRLDLLEGVGDEVESYYDALAATAALGDEEERRRAQALSILGAVEKDKGDLAAAERAYRAAFAIRERQARAAPGEAARQYELGAAHEQLGWIVLAQGDTAGAAAAFAAGLGLAQALVAGEPAHPAWRRLLAQCQYGVAEVDHTLDRLEPAGAGLRAALAIRAELAAQQPDDADLALEVAQTHELLGDLAVKRGQGDEALGHYRTALAIFAGLAGRDQANPRWQRSLSVLHNDIGNREVARGDRVAALASYQAALAIRQRLADWDPRNSERKRDLSVSHNLVAKIAHDTGDYAGARLHYRASLAIMDALTARDPDNAAWRRDQWVVLVNLGRVEREAGDADAALVLLERGRVIIEALTVADPRNGKLLGDLSRTHYRIAQLERARGGAVADAVVHVQRSIEIEQRRLALDPKNADAGENLSLSLNQLGDLERERGDRAAAAAAYGGAIAIDERIVAGDPSGVHRARLAASVGNLGILLAEAPPRAAEARGYLERSRALLIELRDQGSLDAAQQSWLPEIEAALMALPARP